MSGQKEFGRSARRDEEVAQAEEAHRRNTRGEQTAKATRIRDRGQIASGDIIELGPIADHNIKGSGGFTAY